jgi:hypothetical protein
MDPRTLGSADRVGGPIDVSVLHARKSGYHRTGHASGNRLNRLQLAVGGNGESGLDHVDPQSGQLLSYLYFFSEVERYTG